MFKVLCVEDDLMSERKDLPQPMPVAGKTYNVIDESIEDGLLMYELAEIPRLIKGIGGIIFLFDADAFIRLSDVNEKELVKEREVLSTVDDLGFSRRGQCPSPLHF